MSSATSPFWSHRLVTGAAVAQGLLYVATGVWPLIHMDSFEWVTGEKIDDWLVRTVGVLVLVIGGVLLWAAWRKRVTGELAALAVGAALGLTAIDVIYVAVGRIPPVYLLDAVAELALVCCWVAGCLIDIRATESASSPPAPLGRTSSGGEGSAR